MLSRLCHLRRLLREVHLTVRRHVALAVTPRAHRLVHEVELHRALPRAVVKRPTVLAPRHHLVLAQGACVSTRQENNVSCYNNVESEKKKKQKKSDILLLSVLLQCN
jgi:hypothetical protein